MIIRLNSGVSMHRVLIPLVLLASATAAHAQSNTAASDVRADLTDSAGRSLGTVRIRSVVTGVLMSLEARGLPPGSHAVHVHTTGR
jgi:superoxide dismutase, Cu-Zn family